MNGRTAGIGGLLLSGLCILVGVAVGQRAVVLAALASSWLLFAGIAAGAVALAAAIRIADGKWAGGVLPWADAGVGFFVPSLGILAVITLAAPAWMPHTAHASFSSAFGAALRDLVGGLVLYGVGWRLVSASRSGQGGIRWCIAYVLAYAVVMSMWAVDLVMALTEWAPSTAIPAYYFMASLLSGLAWVVLAMAVGNFGGADTRHDAGKLLFGLLTFFAYLLWSIFLPTWYANLPDETGQLLARWQGAYRALSWAVMGLVFVFPFALLLTERAKRRRELSGIGAASVLVGLAVERFLLIFPSLKLEGGFGAFLLAAGTAIGVGGLFVWRVRAQAARYPALASAHAAHG